MMIDIGCEFTQSNPRDPPQNGVSDRSNRSLIDLARTMLVDSQMNRTFWEEATLFACTVLNATTMVKDTNKSAFEIFHRRKPYFGKFHPFGTKCTILDQNPERKKYQATGLQGRLVGLNTGVFGYRVWIPGTRKIVVTKNLTFEKKSPLDVITEKPPLAATTENRIFEEGAEEPSSGSTEPTAAGSVNGDDVITESPPTGRPIQQTGADDEGLPRETLSTRKPDTLEEPSPEAGPSQANLPSTTQSDQVPKRKKRKRKVYQINKEKLDSLRDRSTLKQPERYGLEESHLSESQSIVEPNSYTEAMKSKHRKEWLEAINEELMNMDQLKVWDLVPLPPGRKAIQSRWVFRVKTLPNGDLDRFRARLVLKGFSQRAGYDYSELFSPTVKFETIRCMLNMAVRRNLVIWQADVKCAFLSAKIDSELYMAIPEGYSTKEKNVVCRLNRAIYGAKQSNRCFYQKMKGILIKLNMRESSADPCVFIGPPEDSLFLALYVDDSLVLGRSERVVREFLAKLGQHLDITFKPLTCFLGIQVERISNGLFLHQRKYVDEILDRFKMNDCSPISTPLDRSIYSDDETELIDDIEYRSMIGSVQYLVSCTRADLSFPVSFLSRFLSKPTTKRMSEIRRVFRYLKKTRDYGIAYVKDEDQSYSYFSDSDFASDNLTRKSVSGLMIFANGGPICWKSALQRSVTMSTAEAELAALSTLAQTAQYFMRLVGEFGYSGTPVLQSDNTATIRLVSDGASSSKTKHIALRQFYVKELVENNSIKVSHVGTLLNKADLMTKPHNTTMLKRLLKLVGIRPMSNFDSKNPQSQ